jgi:hypothetical protein
VAASGPLVQVGCSDLAGPSGGATDPLGGPAGGAGVASGGASGSGGPGDPAAPGAAGADGAPAPPLCGEADGAFGGTPRAIPGTVEAEDFDPAGYSDATPGNEGAAYRTDVDVDVKAGGEGYLVGWMTAGEWLEYTVEVAEAGSYRLTLELGSVEAGRTVSVSSCGASIATDLAVPTVASWGETAPIEALVTLEAGRQVLRVSVGALDYLDFDRLRLERSSEPVPPDDDEDNDPVCPLPSSFSWTSSGVLTEPAGNAVSLKDFSVTRYNGKYLVYGTTYESGYKGFFSTFDDFDDWSSAAKQPVSSGVAPSVFYYEPKGLWVLADQWGACPFYYRTTTTPDQPGSWGPRTCMMQGAAHPGTGGTGPIDQSLICDDERCYLFYADDAGRIYRSSLTLDEFPGEFKNVEKILDADTAVIFEAVQVYSLAGQAGYLMIIEGVGIRAFRAWTASSLDGEFTPLAGADSTASPFAGENNVTWPGGKWTRDISHGDLVREDPDQRMEVDPCNLQLLYQGRDPDASAVYDALPYRPGLLTLSP